MEPILATYRMQLHAGFRLAEARARVPYLARLGVTHLYGSPIGHSRPGSTHGYDVVDPTRLDPELGRLAELDALVAELRRQRMGLVLDIVPNHMATCRTNWRWEDVLTHGSASPYARWFDIDWRSSNPELWGRVLLPVLGGRRLRVAERGELSVRLLDGQLRLCYFEHSFPLDPSTLLRVLGDGLDELEAQLGPRHPDLLELRLVVEGLHVLPRRFARKAATRQKRRRRTSELLGRLGGLCARSAEIRAHVEARAEALSRGAGSAGRLLRLLEAQPYRLVFWRRAAREINYRRFFDINDLVALHMQDPEVFAESHELVLRWIAEGKLDALRIDHIDGLLDPLAYLQRLAAAARPPDARGRPFPVFVEKILSHGEALRPDWPVFGTTGYELLNEVEAVFLDPAGSAAIERAYREWARRPDDFLSVAHAAKRRMLEEGFSAYIGPLGQRLQRIARRDPAYASLTHEALERAVREAIVFLPVYRTYVDPRSSGPDPLDRRWIEQALAAARKEGRASAEALELLGSVLLGDGLSAAGEDERQERLRFVQRFQQASGPATAKGVEDTAFYAYVPLLSRNDVGGAPEVGLGDAVARLHAGNATRAELWPRSMLCTSTHDTKRSADLRSRLDVISEIPEQWQARVQGWHRMNRLLRSRVHGRFAPGRNTEWMIYQTLAGAWPLPAPSLFEDGRMPDFRERIVEYMRKAAREAKLHTSWVDPRPDWEQALESFVRGLLPDEGRTPFLDDMAGLVERIARPGLWNALSRLLVHLSAPGVPDIYQGDELWSFSLVDPDNRRPVDFELRERLLGELEARFDGAEAPRAELLRELVEQPEDGRIKLHVTRLALGLRRAEPELFGQGGYQPLPAEGPAQRHVLAYARQSGDRAAVALVPRLTLQLCEGRAHPPVGDAVWGRTHVPLPGALAGRRWHSVLTGRMLAAADGSAGGALRVGEVLADFPVALLLAD
jgi:(1->4)-alpha-D-glucan 1-alpha-D-glucosylmutase